MRLPRKVIVAGKTYKVIRDKTRNGGSGLVGKQIIIVGTECSDEQQLEIFIHEVLELIMVERMVRYEKNYDKPNNGDYIYVFNHAQFNDIMRDLAFAIKGIVK